MDKKFLINNKEVVATDFKKSDKDVSFKIGTDTFSFSLKDNKIHFEDQIFDFKTADNHVVVGELEGFVSLKKRNDAEAAPEGAMIAPMPCKVFKILKEENAKVKTGETVLILEAMKMEHSIKADQDGIIKKIHFKVGELVKVGSLLVDIE